MPKILLVDDERAILHSTRLLLQQMGHDVLVASSAEAILPMLRNDPPDLLLQDVRMPGLDLRDLFDRIRGDSRLVRLPIVLFSASIDLQDVAAQLGAQAIVEKPFRPSDLERILESALDAGVRAASVTPAARVSAARAAPAAASPPMQTS